MKKPLISLIIILVISVGLDQWTKYWAHHTLLDNDFHKYTQEFPVCGNYKEDNKRERFIRRHRESITVINGFFRFRYVENCASAFGLMQGVPESFRFPFFLIVSVLAVILIPYLYITTPTDQKLILYSLPFILGGALGNLIDRIIFRYVIDFIQWYVTIGGIPRHWPTFNIADAAIVIGMGLMILQLFPFKKNIVNDEQLENQTNKQMETSKGN